jgi:hypothetical protein
VNRSSDQKITAGREDEITAGRGTRRTRPKGYATWRPQKKTWTLIRQIEEVLAEYEDYLPLSVRQIFYRLIAKHLYDKTERAYDRLAEVLVRARRARVIPFEVIRDDGVVSYSARWHSGPEAFWDETARRIRAYRRDRQAGQRTRIELSCEAAGMAPQLARVGDDYSVPCLSTGGFASLTAIRLIADRALARTVPTVLLHVGDLDPSGESIFAAIAADAATFVEVDRTINTLKIISRRIALSPEQVVEHGLPTAPAKPSDSRSRAERRNVPTGGAPARHSRRHRPHGDRSGTRPRHLAMPSRARAARHRRTLPRIAPRPTECLRRLLARTHDQKRGTHASIEIGSAYGECDFPIRADRRLPGR